jgi:hypothetical protein
MQREVNSADIPWVVSAAQASNWSEDRGPDWTLMINYDNDFIHNGRTSRQRSMLSRYKSSTSISSYLRFFTTEQLDTIIPEE